MSSKPKALKRDIGAMLAQADAEREGGAIIPEPASEPDPAPTPAPAPKLTRAAPKAIAPGPPPLPEPESSRPVSVQFFLDEADRDRLKMTALHKRTSLNAICHEAISAWLEAQGLPPLKWTAANFPSGRRPKG